MAEGGGGGAKGLSGRATKKRTFMAASLMNEPEKNVNYNHDNISISISI